MTEEFSFDSISDFILPVIYYHNKNPFEPLSYSKLQKLLYLVTEETETIRNNLKPSQYLGYFDKTKLGARSDDVYDSTEMLVNLGYVEKKRGERVASEISELKEWIKDKPIGLDEAKEVFADKDLVLTEEGTEKAIEIIDCLSREHALSLSDYLSDKSRYSLNQLLDYIYRQHKGSVSDEYKQYLKTHRTNKKN